MVPFKDDGHLTRAQKKYNKILCSTRVLIEQAIGLLKECFRRLKYINLIKLEYFKYVVVAAYILHNFRLKNNEEDVDITEIGLDDNGNDNLDFGECFQGPADILAKNKRERIMFNLNL